MTPTKISSSPFDVNSHACQGDIRGQHDSESTAVVSKGMPSYAASVKLYITANELAAPSQQS